MATGRFFAFGCSYTRYSWPTWADIIGQPYRNEYFNYGQAGAGNVFIFNMLMQADQYHKINKNDLVIIQWSSTLREDRYVNNNWVTKGANYFKDLFDMRGYLIRDLGLVKAAKALLENIGCKFYFISMCGLDPSDTIDDILFKPAELDKDVSILYKDVLDRILPSFYDVLGAYTNRPLLLRDKVYLKDSHRIPGEHLSYIKTVMPDVTVDEEFVKEAEKQLFENFQEKDFIFWWSPGRYNGTHNIKRL
jgi:hypothetical protein